MRKLALSVVLALASPLAFAGSVSGTVTLASDYLFDGASQTQGDMAFQTALDWSGDSGFYLGTWFSNVDFGEIDGEPDPADSEVDYYGGYGWEAEGGWAFAVGFVRYTYNGASDYNYTELTSSVTFPFGTEVLAYFADDDVLGGSAYRVKGKHSIALPADFSLDLEATHTNYSSADFVDFNHAQVGVSRAFGPVTAYLGYSDTDDNDNVARDGTFLFTVSASADLFSY